MAQARPDHTQPEKRTNVSELSIHAGDREVIDITITGLTEAKLSGATARFTAKWRVDSPTSILEKATGSGVTIDAAGQKATVVIDPTDTDWIKHERVGLVFDFEVSPSDNSGPLTIDRGTLLVDPNLSA